ncbi:MAG: TonB-dependent receptor [Thiohalomonadaceae bacterium]
MIKHQRTTSLALATTLFPLSVAFPVQGHAQNVMLEEVIVTATRTERNQQEVPVAMAAFSANALEQRGITETTDLSGSVPNLIVSSPFGRTQPNFAIRGISVANEYNANAASPIALYVNEDYKQFRPAHGMQLFDLERIEVIRGPQGTLFGRNTTGGAISIVTKRPTAGEVGELTGSVTIGAGNYNARNMTAAVETTIIEDQLAIRLATTVNRRDGYIKNRTPETMPSALVQAGAPAPLLEAMGLPTEVSVNAQTRKDFASVHDQAMRLSIVWEPNEHFDTFLTYTKGEAKPHGMAIIPRFVANGGQTDAFGYNRGGLSKDEAMSDDTGRYETDTDDVALTMNWHLSDTLTLTSVTGYGEGSYTTPLDCDGTALSVCAQHFDSDFDQLNQDFRFTWEGDRFSLIGGIYYGEDTITSRDHKNFYAPLADFAGIPTGTFQTIASDTSGTFPAALRAQAGGIASALYSAGLAAYPAFNPPVLSALLPPPLGLGSFQGDPTNPLLTATGFGTELSYDQERESKAIYLEGKYSLTDEASITLGLRYTEDDFRLRKMRAAVRDSSGVARFNSIPLAAIADPALVSPDLKASSEEVTGRIIFDYKFNHDLMGFVSYSRGYRAGSFNGSASVSTTQMTFVEPEFVDNYELGFKSRIFDDSVQINGTLFYADYKDQQIQEAIGATTYLRNASGKLYGAEAEVQWQVSSDIFTSLGLGYLKSKYDGSQYFASNLNNGADCSLGPSGLGAAFATQCVDIDGNEFPFAPQLSANIFVEWIAGRWSAGELRLSVTGRYQDDIWFDSFNDDKSRALPPSSMKQDGYALFDASVSFGNEDYTFRLWGKNLTDKYYTAYGIDTAGGFGYDYLVRGEPRMFGADFTYNF